MYERFTDRARKIMQFANSEAVRFNHEYIGTEHVLLGLVREGSGVAANVLKNLDIDLHKLRREVEKIVQAGPDMVTIGKKPHTPRVKRVIELAIAEARRMGHNYVGSEHLLLGLIGEEEGVAAQVLMNMGLSLSGLRQEVLALLGQTSDEPGEEPLAVLAPLATAIQSELAQGSVFAEEAAELPPRLGRAVSAAEHLIKLLDDMKQSAVSIQDYEYAADLRNRVDRLKQLREWLMKQKDRE
jgi:ATP-dependent Clp protease ATP-binding subunit ClpC